MIAAFEVAVSGFVAGHFFDIGSHGVVVVGVTL
jgi:hypothetical protein